MYTVRGDLRAECLSCIQPELHSVLTRNSIHAASAGDLLLSRKKHTAAFFSFGVSIYSVYITLYRDRRVLY